MNYFEYCTLEDFRAAKQATTPAGGIVAGTADGTLLLEYIREVSRNINGYTGRHFAPVIATRYFDAEADVDPGRHLLKVNPFDLLAVTSIANGDTTAVLPASYVFEPRNNPPYWAIRLKLLSGLVWLWTADKENAISVVGTWGYHNDYASAWEPLDTLAAAITTTIQTSVTMTTGVGNPGELWLIDSEILYLSARTTTAATVIRGVNGSTAATHLLSAPISRWMPMQEIRNLCVAAVSIKYAIRENPQIESITVDNHVVSVPKDVNAYLENELIRMGLTRL
jgi:hypothetical protein